jgi:hypothetical protein
MQTTWHDIYNSWANVQWYVMLLQKWDAQYDQLWNVWHDTRCAIGKFVNEYLYNFTRRTLHWNAQGTYISNLS